MKIGKIRPSLVDIDSMVAEEKSFEMKFVKESKEFWNEMVYDGNPKNFEMKWYMTESK